MYTVTITSQGQITIPAKVRKTLGLSKSKKAIVKVEDNKVIVEPVPDIMSLAGILHHRAIKNKPIDEIIKLEKEAVGKAIIENYHKKLKRMGLPIHK